MICILATNNPGKAREIRPHFEAEGLTLLTLADLGLHFEAEENGATYLQNATQKARETADFLLREANAVAAAVPRNSVIAVLADDSGLEIDALDSKPGVDSALFLGRDTPYGEKCRQVLDVLADVPDGKRSARFICQMVCALPNGETLEASGITEGNISWEMSGTGGFGYDPIFYYPPLNKTMAQLTKEEKNKISHRGQALQKMIGLISDADISN